MFKQANARRVFAVLLTAALTVTCVPGTGASAAGKKVKSVTLKLDGETVTKNTVSLSAGETATLKVTAKPKAAVKSTTFKSNKKAVASVTKKGVVTAKKAGTAKVTVTVKGKTGSSKKAWVKIKVTADSTSSTDNTTTTTTDYNNTSFDYASSTNPIGTADENGDPLYGGDPSILVDGDTVYLYVGHDISTGDSYIIPEYCCYSTTDLINWTYEGVVLNMQDVSWADNNSAWAGQVMKYNGKYYMYYCSWDSTDSGKQSIGVAVSDSPTGPFVDKGSALVKGSVTTNESSGWNDIDPTAWIETDENGTEHRYLAWGNGKFFVCELNEDMVSVKDVNGDGEITFGTQSSGKTSADVDIIEKTLANSLNYTEAPWIYRRQDESGNYYGDYYLFYAYGWREQMAYATTDDLMDGTLTFGSVVMEATATSNTNHMAVFDFKGKTYFVYHNGSLPGGNGYRRTPCIAEVVFNDDGSIQTIQETAAGINGTTHKIYTAYQDAITHEHFTNSTSDSSYPYTDIAVGTLTSSDSLDSDWVLSTSFYYPTEESYISIQSENKPGLYLTANSDDSVTLSQNATLSTVKEVAAQQTFKVVTGLSDANGVSFESVSKPGYYITLIAGSLYLTDGSSHTANCTFYLDSAPESAATDATLSSENSLTSLTADGADVSVSGTTYTVTVDYAASTVSLDFTMADADGILLVDGGVVDNPSAYELSTANASVTISVYAADWATVTEYTLVIEKDYSNYSFSASPVYSFNFEGTVGDAFAVTTGRPPVAVDSPSYSYVDGVNGGQALSLDGTYGMELGSASALGDSYSISFWINPTTLGGSVDPIFAAGTFSPEYWLNITAADRGIWSNNGDYVNLENYPTKAYSTGVWQHVLVTVSSVNGSSTGKLYLDGELIASGTVADGIMTQSGAKLYFGVNGWDACFNGAVDEIMLFDSVLSESDATALANGQVTAASLAK